MRSGNDLPLLEFAGAAGAGALFLLARAAGPVPAAEVVLGAGALGLAAAAHGVRAHRPRFPLVWLLLGGGLGLVLLAGAASQALPGLLSARPGFLALAFLLGQGAMAAALAWACRCLEVPADEAKALDAAILLVAVGTLLWVLAFDPIVSSGRVADLLALSALTRPVASAALAAGAVHLLLTHPRRPRALLGMSGAALAVALPPLLAAVLGAPRAPWLAPLTGAGLAGAPLLLGLAALRPGMRDATAPAPALPYKLDRLRTLLLGAALLAGPAAVVRSVALGWGFEPAELLLPSGLVTVLVLIRLRRLFLDKERTERDLASREHLFRRLVEHQSDHLLVVRRDGRIAYQSPSLTRILGYAPKALLGAPASRILPPGQDAVWAELLRRSLGTPETAVAGRLEALAACGEPRAFEATLNAVREGAAGEDVVVVLHDVTERERFEEQLRRQALHDPLTGLANRALVLDRAEEMLTAPRRGAGQVGALFVDLDHFKAINDSLGHEAGDELLVSLAERLQRAVRAGDTVGRMGGDEFVILFESDAAGSERLAGRICQMLSVPVELGGRPYPVTASVGIALAAGGSAGDLLRDADIAMYRAKAAGRNRCVFFSPEMREAAQDRLRLELDLRAALAEQQLSLAYQPAVDLDSLSVIGIEALVRWEHPQRGPLSPGEFIPVAEESGLIADLGAWVLREACRAAAGWGGTAGPLAVSVNVSARQVESDELVAQVTEALEGSGLAPWRLVLEITESAIMRHPEGAARRIAALKALGVRVAVDDFGSGYSSLNYLRHLPVDVLKIDMSFIAAMQGSPTAAAVVHALVQLGKALGLAVVAEGVEAESQLAALRREHCDIGQGFLFARPLAASELEGFLREWPAGRPRALPAAARWSPDPADALL